MYTHMSTCIYLYVQASGFRSRILRRACYEKEKKQPVVLLENTVCMITALSFVITIVMSLLALRLPNYETIQV